MPVNIIIIILIIVFDQFVKLWAATALKAVGTIPLIENAVHFTYAENRGAAFSSFSGHTEILAIVSAAAVVIAFMALVKFYKRNAWLRWGIVFIIGGAVGNLIDRIRLSYVIDMIDFRIIEFAIFNVADSFITIGAVMVAIYVIKSAKDEYRSDKNAES